MRVADLQHGCVHRQQLLAAGIGRRGIQLRVEQGGLHPLERAVYLVGLRRVGRSTRLMAAVLQQRGHALCSHRSAGLVWGITEGLPGPGRTAADRHEQLELTAVGRSIKPRPGQRVHRRVVLDPRDIRWRDGLPVTAPARTLVDLAGALTPAELESALAAATRRRLARPHEIRAAIDRAPRTTKGIGTLRALLGNGRPSPADTRSHYERKLLALIAAAELPSPVTNVPVEGLLVDMYWPQQRLVVEFDGFAYHGDRRAFERDRHRDQRLTAAGLRVMRVTARHIDHTPYAAIARLSAALVAGS